MTARIVSGPSAAKGGLRLQVDVNGIVVPVDILQTRAVGVPEDLPLPLAREAMRAGVAFLQGKELLVHLLLEKVDTGVPVSAVALDMQSVDSRGRASFTFRVEATCGQVRLTSSLRPRGFELDSGEEPAESLFYAVYDSALEYVVRERESLPSLGFDTSELNRQFAALPSGVLLSSRAHRAR